MNLKSEVAVTRLFRSDDLVSVLSFHGMQQVAVFPARPNRLDEMSAVLDVEGNSRRSRGRFIDGDACHRHELGDDLPRGIVFNLDQAVRHLESVRPRWKRLAASDEFEWNLCQQEILLREPGCQEYP